VNDLRPTVVLADDNAEILRVVDRLLRPLYRIVAQVEDGAAAIGVIMALRPRLAVLDLSMPKIDGFEVARRLCKANARRGSSFLRF
jgi:CheY-like chemotaxis protein